MMAEGMEVDMEEGPGPSSSVVKTKKRFEVKKVYFKDISNILIFNHFFSGMQSHYGLGVSGGAYNPTVDLYCSFNRYRSGQLRHMP